MSHLTTFNQNNYELRFQNAYEYLDNIKLEIKGLKSTIELEIHDIVCVVGISELTNMLLTRIGVSCLQMLNDCHRYSNAINAKREPFPAEALLMTLVFIQHKMIIG